MSKFKERAPRVCILITYVYYILRAQLAHAHVLYNRTGKPDGFARCVRGWRLSRNTSYQLLIHCPDIGRLQKYFVTLTVS